MSYLVSKDCPPHFGPSVNYWERSLDPFHADAFKGVAEQIGKGCEVVLACIGGQIDISPKRREGWMAIDWIENPIGFVPDGTEQDGEPPAFEIRPSDMCPEYNGAHRVEVEAGAAPAHPGEGETP